MDPQASLLALLEESQALELAGQIADAIRCAHQAWEAAGGAEPATRALILARLGKLQFRLGHYDVAESFAADALALAPAGHVARGEAWLLWGNCLAETHSLTEAERNFRAAIDVARESGDAVLLFRSLHSLAIAVYMPRGQFGLALAAEQDALGIVRRRGMVESIWWPLLGIGWVHWLEGRVQEAQAAAAELDPAVKPGSAGAGYRDLLRGNLAADAGLADDALAYYESARRIGETTGEPGINVLSRLGLSRTHRACGGLASALDWAEDAVTYSAQVKYAHFHGKALVERSCCYLAAGRPGAAEADLRAALREFSDLETCHDLAQAQLLLAALLHESRTGTGSVGAHARAPSAARRERHRQPRSGARNPTSDVAEPRAHVSTPDPAGDAWRQAASLIRSHGYESLLDRHRPAAYRLLAAHPDDPYAPNFVDYLHNVPAPPLRIYTFGELRVEQGNRPIERALLGTRRTGELLALLLTSPVRTLSLSQVAEALCPERAPCASQTAIYHATSTLRRCLEPELPDKFPSRYVEVSGERISLRLPPGSWVDYEVYEERCRRRAWRAALGLCEGEWLPAYRYADWTLSMRERLSQRRLEALLGAAEEDLENGDCGVALDGCLAVLAEEPWNEAATVAGMRACEALGGRRVGLSLYRDLEAALRAEFDARPHAATAALYRRLAGG